MYICGHIYLIIMTLHNEIQRRRTFGIISHPDAGKTTITEKLIYHGGVIREAGEVKGKQGINVRRNTTLDSPPDRRFQTTKCRRSLQTQRAHASRAALMQSKYHIIYRRIAIPEPPKADNEDVSDRSRRRNFAKR